MRHLFLLAGYFSLVVMILSCSKQVYATNGETIYKTGKNKNGEKLLDKSKSQVTLFKGCVFCHGKNGDRDRNCVITWSALSNPQRFSIPYTDSLFFRFMDRDIKSDGSAAQTGVHWKMSDQDKMDLLQFLTTL